MYQTAKKAREAMKSKAKRLASDRPLQKVDSSTFKPPEMLNADVKTGLRPVSRRAYKSGGKVDGSCGPMRADRKARKSGGKTEATAYANAKVNRNVKDANEEREGIKHVGGMKSGGRAKKYNGGPMAGANRMMADASQRAGVPSAMLGFSGVKRGALSPIRATGLKKGGKADDAAQDKALVKKAVRQHETAQHGGKHSQLKLRRGGGLPGGDPYRGDTTRGLPPGSEDDYVAPPPKTRVGGFNMPREMTSSEREAEQPSRLYRSKTDADFGGYGTNFPYKSGGKVRKADGGGAGKSEIERVLERARAGNPDPKTRYVSYAKEERRPSKPPSALDEVDEEIADTQREAKMEEMYKAFRAKKAAAARQKAKEESERDSNVREGLSRMPMFKHGGEAKRTARASGGRTGKKGKGKTNINIVIDAGGAKAPGLGAMPPLPMPGGRPVPPPMPVGGPGAGAPMGLGAGPMPPAAPPPAMPAGPMPMARKNGGRTMRRAGGKVYRSYKDMDAGAGSGLGRLEKTEIARRN
jgi:hypothetical protein